MQQHEQQALKLLLQMLPPGAQLQWQVKQPEVMLTLPVGLSLVQLTWKLWEQAWQAFEAQVRSP